MVAKLALKQNILLPVLAKSMINGIFSNPWLRNSVGAHLLASDLRSRDSERWAVAEYCVL